MAKTKLTRRVELALFHYTDKTGVFGCEEVTIGFFGKERVDYMTMDTKGTFRCYEIKTSKWDFYSDAKKSFVGHYNYFVLPLTLYEQVKDDIPDWVGVIAYNEETNIIDGCIVNPKRRNIDNQDYVYTANSWPKEIIAKMPWTKMLEDSLLRSLARCHQNEMKKLKIK